MARVKVIESYTKTIFLEINLPDKVDAKDYLENNPEANENMYNVLHGASYDWEGYEATVVDLTVEEKYRLALLQLQDYSNNNLILINGYSIDIDEELSKLTP